MSAGPRAPKERVDVLLVSRGLAPTRHKAQALVMAGQVFLGDQRIDKPGAQLPSGAALVVRAGPRFVSRGGDKLEGALAAFAPHGLAPRGKVCLDVGASTGGFTDCLLAHGAARVYAVDVGHGQLHPRLRADPRVVVREGVNARELRRADFPEPLELVVVDASFISLGKLLPALAALLEPGGELVALVKPQFEAGRKEVARGRGVIRDPATREAAIATATDALGASGFALVAAVDSAV
ncbi:MAG: TlyA family RNA methyltransferase, partial [Polyangiaceae bacterium]|nr:TlyA family RNA methyltransferase [Polyangiaceae bacterium]